MTPMLSVRTDVIADLEVLGRQCLDSGACHHGCTKTCARRTGLACVPLSVAGSYLNDDWTLKEPAIIDPDTLELLDELEDARLEMRGQETGPGQALGHAINWIHDHASSDGLNDAYAEGRKDEAEEQQAARATLTESLSTTQAALQKCVERAVLMRGFLTLAQQEQFDAAWLAKSKQPAGDDHPEADYVAPHPAGPAGAHLASVLRGACGCRACLRARDARDESGYPILMGTFIVCLKCGNKRCPHANDHLHACTGSNEPGQVGSAA